MFVDNVSQFVFPNRCVICDTILPYGDKLENRSLCKDCRDKIEFIKEPTCRKCGASIYEDDESYCTRCNLKMRDGYDFGFGLCRYNDFVKESIHRIKYNGRKEYIDFYGKCIAKIYHDKIKKLNIDCFVPVPIHRARYIKRTYNQAAVLAYSISKNLCDYGIDIPVNEDLIVRTKNTKVLNKLDDTMRNDELKNAFKVYKDDSIINVMIVDDIYTTGSTIDEIGKLLKASGISKVYFVSIAVVDNL